MNIYNKKISALLLLILFSNVILGQSDVGSKISSIIPPSPESASLGKYGNIPVNYYNGLPSVGIPLYTIKDKDISVNIGLSYHASGVRVDELPSSVGTSWVLNAGGAITRTIKGLPDEAPYGYRGSLLINLWNNYKNNQMTSTEKIAFERGVADGTYDTQPDEYFFNFLGQSGMMLFRQDGSAFLTEASAMKVEVVDEASTNTKNFIITDTQGTKYYFTEKEYTKALKLCNNVLPSTSSSNVSAWYISKIESTSGSTINLSYTRKTYTYSQGVYESFSQTYAPEGCSGMAFPQTNRNVCIANYTTEVPYISSIGFTNGNVSFNYSDTNLGLRLSSMEAKSRFGESVKSYVLNYFNANGRIFLSSVTENTAGGIFPGYAISYNSADLLPARNSVKQDYWGYANNNSSQFLLPQLPAQNANQIEWANRNPDPTMVKYGMINSIKYPTGGFSKFEFEINQYGYTRGTANSPTKNIFGGGVRIKSILDSNAYTVEADVVVSGRVAKRRFEYSDLNDSERSSGTISTFQSNYYVYKKSQNSCSYSILVGNSNSMNDLGSTQGPIVGYKYVTEIFENNPDDNIGKVQYTFTNLREIGDPGLGNVTSPPFVMLTSKEKYRGKVLNISYFNKNQAKVKEEIFEYDNREVSYMRGFKAMIANDWNNNTTLNEIEKSEYEYLSIFSQPKTKKVIVY